MCEWWKWFLNELLLLSWYVSAVRMFTKCSLAYFQQRWYPHSSSKQLPNFKAIQPEAKNLFKSRPSFSIYPWDGTLLLEGCSQAQSPSKEMSQALYNKFLFNIVQSWKRVEKIIWLGDSVYLTLKTSCFLCFYSLFFKLKNGRYVKTLQYFHVSKSCIRL